jgi:hypothetical protein
MKMEGEGFSMPAEKMKPNDGSENLLLTHIEKIQRGEKGVVNMYRTKDMFNEDGELFSKISVQKTKENPSIGDQEERRN